MRRRSPLAIMLVSVALLMSFSVVVASNTNEIPNQNPTQSNNLQSSFINESEGETFTVTVDGTNLRFSPDTIIIKEGDTVRFLWENQLLPHNAVERNGVFDSGDPERNVDYTYTFNVTENGTYEYVCEPHEDLGMIGTIIVEPKPVPEPEPEEPVDEDDDSICNVCRKWRNIWVPFCSMVYWSHSFSWLHINQKRSIPTWVDS